MFRPSFISAVVVALVALGWFFRWEIVPVHSGSSRAVYQLNRWTGNMYVIVFDERIPVVDEAAKVTK